MKPNEPLIPVVQLWDGAVTKHVLCHLKTDEDIILPQSPVELGHVGYGKYTYTHPDLVFPEDVYEVHGTYVIYDDEDHTSESLRHQRTIDVWRLETLAGLETSVWRLKNQVDRLVQKVDMIPIAAELTGEILIDEDLEGFVDMSTIVGFISEDEDLDGYVDTDELIGFIEEDTDLNGSLSNG